MKRIQLWRDKAKSSAKIPRKNSLPAILFSVLLAIVVWFFVQDAQSPNYTKTFSSVDVKIQSLSGGLSAITGEGVSCDVTLRGKRSDLNKIKASDLEAYLDLSQITRAGRYDMDVSVLLPEGAELSECFPQKVSVFVDETVAAAVPVRVLMGEYETEADVTLTPQLSADTVVVKGPKSLVDTVSFAGLETGDLAKVTTGFERNLEYKLFDVNGREISDNYLVLDQRSQRVSFRLTREKTVPLVVRSAHGYWQEGDITYTLSPGNVMIKGDPAVVGAIEEICAVTLDESKIDAIRYTQKISPDQLELPDGVELAGTMGDVDLTLNLVDSMVRTLRVNLNSSHVVVTAPENLKYSFDIDVLKFRVRGRSQNIYAASEEDFFFHIDLSVYTTPGEREVEIQIVQTTATEGLYYVVGTYPVKVNLTE